MQKTRRRARYEAWHDGSTGSSSLNPFAYKRKVFRPDHTLSAGDEENGTPTKIATEENATVTEIATEETRSRFNIPRADSDGIVEERTEKSSEGGLVPRHAATVPSDDTPTEGLKITDYVAKEGRDDVMMRKGLKGRPFARRADATEEEVKHDEDSDEKKSTQKFTVFSQLRAIFFNSWAHLLLLFIPTGFVVQYTHRSPVTVFCVNFVAMLPSIMVISFAVDEIGLKLGETLGGLVSTTFNNAAQLITSILLLRSRQIVVLQISLIRAILSNLLLMPGLSFFFGGIHRIEQCFNVTLAQCISTMLLLAVFALMIPSAAHILTKTDAKGIRQQSRGISMVLLVAYGCSLYFQLGTHAAMWNAPGRKVEKRYKKIERGETIKGIAEIGARSAASSGGQIARSRMYQKYEDEEEDEMDQPQLPFSTAVGTSILFTTFLTFSTLFSTDSINGLLEHVGISETFLGLVILPILSNDPTTLIVAVKDKLDLTLALTLWKCVQIALLVIPFIVILGWIMDVDNMTLNFGSFEIVVLFASILVVNYIVQDGKSDWLVGALLVAVYVIIAIAAFFVP